MQRMHFLPSSVNKALASVQSNMKSAEYFTLCLPSYRHPSSFANYTAWRGLHTVTTAGVANCYPTHCLLACTRSMALHSRVIPVTD